MKILQVVFVFSNGFVFSLGRFHHEKQSENPTAGPSITAEAEIEEPDLVKEGTSKQSASQTESKTEKVSQSQGNIQNEYI